jgi:uroporphyrinogen III methyltransferase/synthase
MTKAFVYLIGAGPGDPDLLTLKGLACLQRAEVVIYDRLVSPRLLAYVHPEAELIYAGKAPEKHTYGQEEINRLLVSKARENKVVARLKGGDPFVFGRGGEEILTLKAHGIPFAVVPGVTSAVAVPAYAGIPVTHRGAASMFSVVTGNEDPAKATSSIPWGKLGGGQETLVFLMGMAKLPGIVARLLANGYPAQTPVAVVHRGTTARQRTLAGTLDDIVTRVQDHGLESPAVIIVGEVVKLREQLAWFEARPLFGKTVVVTRPLSQVTTMVSELEALGAEVYPFPTIKIAPLADYRRVDAALDNLKQYQWIIFTSVNGVTAFFKRLRYLERDIRELSGVQLGAIGPQTARALLDYGLKTACVPPEYRAEAIVSMFAGTNLTGQRVLLPRADIARRLLPEALRTMGALVDEVAIYRTVPGGGNVAELVDLLAQGAVDVLTFTSSSTATNFVSLLARKDLPALLKNVTIASIGPVTSATLAALGFPVHVEAEVYIAAGLVAALVAYFAKEGEVVVKHHQTHV